MRRKIVCGVAVMSACLMLGGCHSHEWTEADCTNPKTCKGCGETEGEASGHKWEEASCILPVTCSVCGETEGEASGHKWGKATCAAPATCSVCGETEGEALPHTWTEANFQRPDTCSVCGETRGEPKTPEFVSEGIACHEERNTAYEYITGTQWNPEQKTTGRLILSDCHILEPDTDSELESPEGYEWKTAQFEILFNDRNALMYMPDIRWLCTDYYNMGLFTDSREDLDENSFQYTVNYNGEDYTECLVAVRSAEMSDLRYGVLSATVDMVFRLPKDYDGAVVGFFDSALLTADSENAEKEPEEGSKENSGEKPEEETQEDFELTNEGITYIRLNPISAQDAVRPAMTVINGCIPLQPGERLESSDIIRYSGGNEEEYTAGFIDLCKVGELTDFEIEKFWESAPVYTESKLEKDTGLLRELKIPEEGVYEVTAAVRDRNGNAVTALLTILADGTAPEIHVPRENVSLRSGDAFDPIKDVYGIDNLWTSEDCQLSVDPEEFMELAAAFESGRAGSYKLTYIVTDMAGNIADKEITVRLISGESRPQGEGQTTSGPDTGGNAGQQETPESGSGQGWQETPGFGDMWQDNSAAASDRFMEDMATAAFANVNAYRAEAGLTALAWDDTIYAAAQVRAQELVTSFSHTRPDGSDCFTALPGYSYVGENIAMGFASADAVCNGWYNSQGHKDNMLNGNFTKGAIACWYRGGTYYWVNLFAQ